MILRIANKQAGGDVIAQE